MTNGFPKVVCSPSQGSAPVVANGALSDVAWEQAPLFQVKLSGQLVVLET